MKIVFPNPKLLYRLIVVTMLFYSMQIQAQAFTNSNLPIVIITTDLDPITHIPQAIVDDPRIIASMKIIQHPDGSRNYLSDQNTTNFLNYNGRISIEIRGSFSQNLPKKSYGLTTLQSDNSTNNNVSLLGMPSENDWILNSLAFDPSLIRDYLSYNLFRQMGNYASRTEYCEVIINGEYMGLYLLEEKIKADSNRVNILKITTSDTTSPNITGGYITKADKTTGGDPVAWEMPSYNSGNTNFIHDLPKPEAVTVAQNTYIEDQFIKLAIASHTNNSNLENGYPSVIDIPTFVDFMIINELASNVDGYQLSTYFHKDRNGKLRAGPIWDFNLTYGNDLFAYGFDRSKINVWQFSNGDNEGAKFWTDLFNNPTFKCYLSKRWNQLTQAGQPLKHNDLVPFIDATVAKISEAVIRENAKWGTIPNHTLEIANIELFLYQRINWLTSHLGSFAACDLVSTPALVIDKINYNPETVAGVATSNDLEFIEIKNTESSTIDLTGIYFKELGVTYQFPPQSSIEANQSIYLASNTAVFQSHYGIPAFGQYTRNLSNHSQKLVLADGFGNTIDTVEYFDAAPWPDADGNGNYLQLISTSLDNSLASSWIATSSSLLSNTAFSNSDAIVLFPNPVDQELTIHSNSTINGIKIYDILGSLIYVSNQKSTTITTNCNAFSKGVYFVTIFDAMGTTTRKFIKQ